MPESTAQSVPRVRPRRGIRLRTILLALVGLFVLSLAIGYFVVANSASRMLQDAIAEADRLDPGWRLPEIESRRETIPDAENSARQAVRVLSLMPLGWPPSTPRPIGSTDTEWAGDVVSRMELVPPEVRLSEPLAAEARGELDPLAEAVAEARKLADMPRGITPILHAPNPLMTLLPHVQSIRTVARLLDADARLRLHDGDIDGGLDSCRALLNAGRSLGDEPFMISQLVRNAVSMVALDTIQRALAQGEPSDAALARLQALLAEDAKHSSLLVGLRGERAAVEDLMTKLTNGELNMAALNAARGGGGLPSLPFTAAFYEYNHALLIGNTNRAVEIAKRPDHEQLAAIEAWERASRPPDQFLLRMAGSLNIMMAPSVVSFGVSHLRYRATLRSTIAMVAAERHRLAHGAWPESVEAIDPRFGLGLDVDPFSGQPLKFRRDGDRLLIYAVGFDGADNGGKYNRRLDWRKLGTTDIGVTLFDPASRRQPPNDELPKDVFQKTRSTSQDPTP